MNLAWLLLQTMMICSQSKSESSDETNPPAAVTHIIHKGQPIVHDFVQQRQPIVHQWVQPQAPIHHLVSEQHNVHEYVVQPPPEHHFVAEQQVHHFKPVILANGQTPQTVVHVHHVVNEEARQIEEMDDAEYYGDEEGEEYYDDQNYYADEEYNEEYEEA